MQERRQRFLQSGSHGEMVDRECTRLLCHSMSCTRVVQLVWYNVDGRILDDVLDVFFVPFQVLRRISIGAASEA